MHDMKMEPSSPGDSDGDDGRRRRRRVVIGRMGRKLSCHEAWGRAGGRPSAAALGDATTTSEAAGSTPRHD